MDIFGEGARKRQIAELRESLKNRMPELPFAGRKKIGVIIWIKMSPTGERSGLTMKCEIVGGTMLPVAFLDMETAKRFMYLTEEDYGRSPTYVIYSKKDWKYPKDTRVGIIRPEDVADVKVSAAFAASLSDEFNSTRAN